MTFHWFAEVTAGGVPHSSRAPDQDARVAGPIGFADPRRIGEDHRMVTRLVQQADRAGFDGRAVSFSRMRTAHHELAPNDIHAADLYPAATGIGTHVQRDSAGIANRTAACSTRR